MHYMDIRTQMIEWERKNGRRLYMKEVSDRTGISTSVLARMTSPSGYVTNTRYLEAICRFFGVGPSEILVFVPSIDPDGLSEIDLPGLDHLGRTSG